MKLRTRHLFLALGLATLVVAGCGEESFELIVDVRTDLAAGRDFTSLRTEIVEEALDFERARAVAGDADPAADYLAGHRAAEYEVTGAGTYLVRVSLLDESGAVALVGQVRVTLDSNTGVTVVLTRSCADVDCSDTDSSMAQCLGARCVSIECTPENPDECGVPSCDADADCALPVACAEGHCIDGVCFEVPVPDSCPATASCDTETGCVSEPGVEPVAFRVTEWRMVDPHWYARPLVSCMDLSGAANDTVQSDIDSLDVNFMILFRPLVPDDPSALMELVTGADCEDRGAGAGVECARGIANSFDAVAHNEAAGETCYAAAPETLNASYRAPASPEGPCFVTEPFAFMLDFTPIPLEHAILSANYAGDRIDGVAAGFLTSTAARATRFPESISVLGGDDLYSHLAVDGDRDASCSSENDRDLRETEEGFWMYFNFTAERVTWVDG